MSEELKHFWYKKSEKKKKKKNGFVTLKKNELIQSCSNNYQTVSSGGENKLIGPQRSPFLPPKQEKSPRIKGLKEPNRFVRPWSKQRLGLVRGPLVRDLLVRGPLVRDLTNQV